MQNPETLWKEVFSALKISLSVPTLQTYFSSAFIFSIKKAAEDRQVVEIGCPSSFIARGIEERHYDTLRDALNQLTGLKNDIFFVVKQKPRPEKQADEPLFLFNKQDNGSALQDSLKKAGVRLGFTFDNFAVSGTNQMAHAAAEAVAKNPGSAYNPLFFYGGVGVGKTHLMLAIAHKLINDDYDSSVLYCTGEAFTNEIVEAIRNKSTQGFKNRYRKLKLLMVDDIQFIAGKEKVQEEFFHTFNTLQGAGSQVVLTSDRPPDEINKLEDRLRSRFEAGLIVDISPADFELRAAIALIKAKERGVELAPEVAQLIAEKIDSPRRIEGFITKLMTQVNLDGTLVTADLVLEALGQAEVKSAEVLRRAVAPQAVIDAVTEYYSLAKKSLLGDSRAQVFVKPRQILMYLLRKDLGLPLQEVGRLIGGRDHTTVMHGVQKISTRLVENSSLREDIVGIKRQFS